VNFERLFAVGVLTALMGCSAKLVATRGDSKSAHAPVNEKSSRGGTVEYRTDGFGRDAKREDAYRKMHTFCGGPYAIVSENPRQEEGASFEYELGTTARSTRRFQVIEFNCK
jgi:hypothetical protein